MSIAAIGSLGLAAGCGGATAGSAEGTGSGGSESGARAEPNFAGGTSLSVDQKLDAAPKGANAVLLAPGVKLRFTKLGTVDSLPTKVYHDVAAGASISNTNGNGSPQQVHPADGQVFLVAHYKSDNPRWEPDNGDVPESTATLWLRGNKAAELFSTEQGTMQGGTVVASVPESPRPGAATIRVETNEKSQTLSLVNGKRLKTDVPQVYEAGTEVRLGTVETLDETFQGWTDDEERIGGEVTDAFVTPYLNEEHGGDGWASNGKTYLSVAVDWTMSDGGGSFDHSTIQVKLPNGSTVSPVNDPASITNRFEGNAVFAIPADTEKATVVLHGKVTVGISEDDQDFGKATAELTIS